MFRMNQIFKFRAQFSKIKRQQILDSNYDQLADKIALHYNLKQYKNESGMCLLQLHHQFKIFNVGDCVLDIGSGVDYAWTDLALKLTDNQSQSNLVISNDILPLNKNRKNNIFVQGKIQDQPTKVKIGLTLQQKDRIIDTILVDVSPQFSGSRQVDGRFIAYTISQVLQLSHDFLKKGGTLVYKMLQSDAQIMLKDTCSAMFNQTYKYVPSLVRKTSPVCFYVLKGYLISYHYVALQQFMSAYKGTPDQKRKLVEQYKGKYNWDPIKIARKMISSQIFEMKKQGRKEQDIIKVLGSDPFLKVQKTLKLLKELEHYQLKKNNLMEAKILNQLYDGDLYKQSVQMPSTKQQFLELMTKQVNKQEEQHKQPKNTINRAPLKQGEQYMKESLNTTQNDDSFQKKYLKGDLEGKYSQKFEADQVKDELQKMQATFPELMKINRAMNQQAQKNPSGSIQQIMRSVDKRYELSPQRLRQIQMQLEQANSNMTQNQRQEEAQLDRQFRMQTYEPKKADRPINQRVGRRRKPRFNQ